ncbi:uncharacterized protein B0J16DRAFT_375471 [Fusarium flagelliforme]|uniref:uncharacterized protein n=1 Tax=Fusarium flagelliforme TaxID=2675880 RepID=UPI001E8E1C8E|nr:uncharacterized protein B0J16DRAFT_375471 [Fusarium flagelliforme]KAH7174664.1 hypothetical protein B0J16DRAFT_375471 [Fusarium flagelliforme]
MATLDALRIALKRQIPETISTKPLSDAEYEEGFDLFWQHHGWTNYQDFVIPQLSRLLAPQLQSRNRISVLEIGPGPRSVLGYLPSSMRRSITKYTAFEPNRLFARKLIHELDPTGDNAPFPSLKTLSVHERPFTKDTTVNEKYHIIIFCHSLYGIHSKEQVVRRSINLLATDPDGILVVCHRDGALQISNLVCHQSSLFPEGVVRIKDNDTAIDKFANFIAVHTVEEQEAKASMSMNLREVCRALARHDNDHQGFLAFAAPEIIMTFNQHAGKLEELTDQVPLFTGIIKTKSRQVHFLPPAAVVRPTKIKQVRACVTWALKHQTSLTIVGGGHSGHCRWPGTVSVDMSAFDKVHAVQDVGEFKEAEALVVAGAGCKTGDIIQTTMAHDLMVPLGARPSVGAGLWLQGGLGHSMGHRGLASDCIVGAVLRHRPRGAVRPEKDEDMLWALRGAGTNFGIIVSVIFKAYTSWSFSVTNWRIELSGQDRILQGVVEAANRLNLATSADAYLYYADDQPMLGVTLIESAPPGTRWDREPFNSPERLSPALGQPEDTRLVNAVELFDTEMYVSGMHGGHGGGKTNSFKRCVFVKNIEKNNIIDILTTALNGRPSSMCYFHLLQGAGEVEALASDATAFGCRDWDYACVITGVWPREEHDTSTARATIRWVYDVVDSLLPVCKGVYSADLGPDPRDAKLVNRAFGPNLRKLVRLKQVFDPHRVLPYACPLSQDMLPQKLVVLVTGKHAAGKDYCANIWASQIEQNGHSSHAVCISDVTKREYAESTGADLNRLLEDRNYKETHRASLSAFYQAQLKQRPRLGQDHFLDTVKSSDVDVLLITGLREEAPVSTLWHLVPNVRLVDVRVDANDETRNIHRNRHMNDSFIISEDTSEVEVKFTSFEHRPSFTFNNNVDSSDSIFHFAKDNLLPFVADDLRRLAGMVRSVPGFPRVGIEFRHVLNICSQAGGIALCIELLKKHYQGKWSEVDAIVSCATGGFVFAIPLAQAVNVPMVPIWKAGKLPPPTISVNKKMSHISSKAQGGVEIEAVEVIEIDANALRKGARVVVVDDVLATGITLQATIELLLKTGVSIDDISVMVVAEFPVHLGRARLRRFGLGRVGVQSLLVFDGE